jgi:hypothetical protein
MTKLTELQRKREQLKMKLESLYAEYDVLMSDSKVNS